MNVRIFTLFLSLVIISLSPLQMAYAESLLPPPTPTEVQTAASNLPIKAQLNTDELTELSAQRQIQITSTLIPLHSKLQKTYQGYHVTVQSTYPGMLHLQSASINNGQSGVLAFETVRSSTTPVYLTFLLGVVGFVLIGLPMLVVKNNGNEHTRVESLPYTNQIPMLDLGQGQSLNFKALVPLGQKPDISLTFSDWQSGRLVIKRSIN